MNCSLVLMDAVQFKHRVSTSEAVYTLAYTHSIISAPLVLLPTVHQAVLDWLPSCSLCSHFTWGTTERRNVSDHIPRRATEFPPPRRSAKLHKICQIHAGWNLSLWMLLILILWSPGWNHSIYHQVPTQQIIIRMAKIEQHPSAG